MTQTGGNGGAFVFVPHAAPAMCAFCVILEGRMEDMAYRVLLCERRLRLAAVPFSLKFFADIGHRHSVDGDWE